MSQRTPVPDQSVIDAIETGAVHTTRRLEIYESDNKKPWVPVGTPLAVVQQRLLTESSTVTIDMTRDERRMIDMQLDNTDGLLHPNPFGGFWYDKILRPYKGVELSDGTTWETPMGQYLIDGIDYDNFPHTIKVTGRDFTKKLMGSKLTQSESFDASRKTGVVIKNVAINAGIDPLKIDIPNDLDELGTQQDFAAGTSRWDICKQLATAAECYIYFDAAGWLVVEHMVDPYLTPFSVTFQTGKKGNLVKFTKSVNDSELYNHIVVKSDGTGDGLGFFGEAINTDPDSPTNVDRIGDRYKEYVLNTLGSDAQAARIAGRFLSTSGLESYVFSFDSISYAWQDVGTIARVIEPQAVPGDPNKFLLDTLNIPLGPGPMSGTSKRITVVGATSDPYTPPDDSPGGDDPGNPPGDPEPPPDPGGDTGGGDHFLAVVSFNMGGTKSDPDKVNDLAKIVDAGADVIGCQEGGDRGKVFDKFLTQHPHWAIWKGDNLSKQSVAILYRKKLGTVVTKRAYLAHDKQYVGEHGVTATIKPKYVMRLDIKLDASLRTVSFVNTHMLPSATRSKKSLGATEWNKRRNHYQQHMQKLTDVIDGCPNMVIGTGDYNATPTFDLLNPLWTRVNLDYYGNTLGGRQVDFIYHKTPAPHLSIDHTDLLHTTSDHDQPMVFYKVTHT